MGSLLAVPIIMGINKLIKLGKEINGQWFKYLYTLLGLLRRRKENKTNRIMKHDIWKDTVQDSGALPFPHEWQYDLPSKDKSEDLLIYGVNSSKQSICIQIKWRPNTQNNNKNKNRVNASIRLRFDDNSGNYYSLLEENSEVEYKKKEYRVNGLGVEILSPFRRKRIKFRGYLLKNDKQLVYVKFRFLWLSFSRVHDFTNDFDDYFMAKEMTKSGKNQVKEQKFEDRLEQFGQMKGTFDEENQEKRNLYFWGSISKKYLMTKTKNQLNRRIIRICGYNRKGIGFDLGFLSVNNQFEYRFGFLFNKKGRNHLLNNISLEKTDFEDLIINKRNIKFKAKFGEKEYNFEINENENSFGKNLLIDGIEGMCYIFEENDGEFENNVNNNERIESEIKDSSLVLGFNEENAKSVELSGGKGSSLAVLKGLSEQLVKDNNENQFSVGNGIVVTTNAYELMIGKSEDLLKQIKELEKSTQLSKKELRIKCSEVMNSISIKELNEIIKQEIEKKLNNLFSDYSNKLFAVRSSGASEDSEEMSAAGQMTTYLGVKGLSNICSNVMKCWSSQFSEIAVEYKRGYGQRINSPMAVVIQEMIDCESAGVMFTCDPISGEERLIEITANYGLGESVVSASAEPDTIKVSVNIESYSLSVKRTVNKIVSKVIGKKKSMIKLSENGGTVEEEVNDNSNCCVSDEDLLRLADIGLQIHKHYGNARDIEWGIKGGKIFMLQSRPVTNLDNSFTDYEIMHEMDSPHQTEFEIYSRAHWGENFPGASSWLVLTWLWSGFRRGFARMNGMPLEEYNPFVPTMAVQYNQLMFNLTTGIWDFFDDYPETNQSKGWVLSMFGHHIEDKDLLNAWKETRKQKKKPSVLRKIKMFFGMFLNLLFGPKNLIKSQKYYMNEIKFDIISKLKTNNGIKETFYVLAEELRKSSVVLSENHGPVSSGSAVKNAFLKNAIEGALSDNPYAESDFNLMISSCTDVISAEVPNSLSQIAKSIEDKESFKQLSDEEALDRLKNGTDESSKKFNEFLERHGHRGYRELDYMYLPWADNPMPCVKNIKAILTGKESSIKLKKDKSVEEVMNELETPLSFTRKLLIKKLLLPWSRSGVGYRELSKYFMIWMNNKQRQAFRYLANKMVSEGLIPSVDMFFFLTIEEIEILCNGERDPMILNRVRLRKRVYPKMDKYKFEEFIKGPEMKPKNFDEQLIPRNLANGSVRMVGTPVSSGTVKARVCVSEDITEADSIQFGDILITYSTDIGWSPYFPLLSGIITEIGGTISHGAVIAREYGIPSLIAVEGACRAFKTGDICVLDTESCSITKVG